MEDKNKPEAGRNASTLQKKTWIIPDVEIISSNTIQSGQAGQYFEATFTGYLPFSRYHS